MMLRRTTASVAVIARSARRDRAFDRRNLGSSGSCAADREAKGAADQDRALKHDPAALACLKRDGIGLNRHRALGCCLSMIFSENRFALFRIML
jgi:hypothetical protein